MQTRNLIVFILLSIVLMLGYAQLQFMLWPVKEKPKPEPVEPVVVKGKSAPLEWPWRKQPAVVQQEVLAKLIASGSGPEPVVRLATEVASLVASPPELPKVAAQPKPKEAEKIEEITLGDEPSFLRVKLTSKGAAAREIVLTQFQAADDLGLPMTNLDGQPLPVEIAPPFQVLQRRNEPTGGRPKIVYDLNAPCYHYRLYHYARPEDDRPVDTLAQRVWRVAKQERLPDQHRVDFETDLPEQGVRITKRFTLQRGDYHLGLTIKIDRIGEGAEKFRYQLTGAHGLPIEGVWYTTIYRNALFGRVEKNGSLWRILEDSRQIGTWQVGGERHDRGAESYFRYAGIAGQYFASMVVLDNDQKGGGAPTFIERVRATVEAPRLDLDKDKGKQGEFTWAAINPEGGPNSEMPFLNDLNVRLVSEALTVPASGLEHRYLLYNGPVKVRLMHHLAEESAVAYELVERYEHTLQLSSLTDYPSPGFFGEVGRITGLSWLIIWFTNVMHGLLRVLHTVLPYGLAIVAITVIVRGIMFPISRRQAASSKELQEKMAKLGPEMKKLQEKYKDDFNALNQARMELYKKHNINPLASMGGCLLLLAQMPVFLGLYYCLQESIFFRLDSFLWMPSLAAPDMLVWWSEAIPIISRPQDLGSLIYLGPFLNLLPIVTIVMFIVQQKIMMPPPTDEQQEMQQSMMKWMMIFIGVMFYKVPAGLCIYFIASTLWGLTERQFLPKKKESAAGEPPADEDRSGGDGGRRKPKPDPDANGNGWKKKLGDWWEGVLKDAGSQRQARREDGRKSRS